MAGDALLITMISKYIRLITTAKVYDVVQQTPLTHAINLSNRLESNVLLKREDLHPVFSFKIRGAYNKMAHLSQEDRWKGVIACSAGMTNAHLSSHPLNYTRLNMTSG